MTGNIKINLKTKSSAPGRICMKKSDWLKLSNHHTPRVTRIRQKEENSRMTSRRISPWCIKTLIVVFSIVAIVIGGPPPSRDDELEDYCSAHKFDKLPGGLRFTKEVVTTEYANIGAFKAVHCCLRGYRSIEWIYIAIESIRAEYKSSQEADDIEGSQRRVELVFQVIREEEQSSVTSHAGTNYPFPEDNYRSF
ncbi:hypothetical protein KQX54_001240 [Cotesia glomerata]|uniref:Uncharacterized protein n=1 Tax=Cotesia glomerata TaxID=32391 RepID=A0AAV7I431_COTGL|nr:hypothetical protein KQX54_001240 [Cotesia glomerata]